MIRRVLPLLALVIALHGAPAAAWGVGYNIGTVNLQPGSTVCSTLDDALLAIARLNGKSGKMPTSCGYLRGVHVVRMRVVDHRNIGGQIFAVLLIVFRSSNLGLQYGWAFDDEEIEI